MVGELYMCSNQPVLSEPDLVPQVIHHYRISRSRFDEAAITPPTTNNHQEVVFVINCNFHSTFYNNNPITQQHSQREKEKERSVNLTRHWKTIRPLNTLHRTPSRVTATTTLPDHNHSKTQS